MVRVANIPLHRSDAEHIEGRAGSTAVTRESADMGLTCYWRVWWREAAAVSGRPSSQLFTLARINALVSLRSTWQSRATSRKSGCSGAVVRPSSPTRLDRERAARGATAREIPGVNPACSYEQPEDGTRLQ